jgi:hypothetical protein
MTRLHRIGWLLFTASAVVFLAIGLRDGDWLSVIAGVLFTAGCLAFLIPERRSYAELQDVPGDCGEV